MGHVDGIAPIDKLNFKLQCYSQYICDSSDAYILVSGIIIVAELATGGGNNNIEVVFEYTKCPPFTDCVSEINNTQIDNAKDIDVVKPMYNLIEHSDSYSKTFGS